MLKFIADHALLGIGIGWFIGCWTPGIARKVKSWVTGEAKVIGSKIDSGVKKL